MKGRGRVGDIPDPARLNMKISLFFLILFVVLLVSGGIFISQKTAADDYEDRALKCSNFCLCCKEDGQYLLNIKGEIDNLPSKLQAKINTVCPAAKVSDPNICTLSGFTCVCNPLPWDDIPRFIEELSKQIFIVVMILAVLMLLIGAFILMTSAGDPGRTKLGKDIIKWAAIGLIIILVSSLMIGIVQKILGPTSP